jgi:hypothetical protein
MYATPEYYTNEYGGTLISQENVPSRLAKAERDIDHLCFGRIKGKGFDNLSSYQQNLIKEAVCLQADYHEQYGSYINSPLKSYSAGSTRVEMADVTYCGISTTQEIINLLEDTGLRCRVL